VAGGRSLRGGRLSLLARKLGDCAHRAGALRELLRELQPRCRVALYGVDIGGVAAGLAGNADWLAGDYSERMLELARKHTSRDDYVHPYSQTWLR